MRIFLSALAVASIAAGGALAASPIMKVPTPKPIDGGAKLTWVVRPDAQKAMAIADDNGARHGSATVECTINGAGRPKDCTVVSEEGNNFGRFAADLAGNFKAASKDADGASPEGRKVSFSISMGGAGSHP